MNSHSPSFKLGNTRFSSARSLGISLVEILLVIGVSAAITVGAFIAYGKAKTSSMVEVVVQEVADVIRTTRQGYSAEKNNNAGAATFNASYAICNRLIPSTMAYTATSSCAPPTGGTLTGQWGPVDMAFTDFNGAGTGRGFSITYFNIPVDACSRLLVSVDRGIDVMELFTGPQNAGTAYTTVKDIRIPASRVLVVANAVNLCNSTAVSGVVSARLQWQW